MVLCISLFVALLANASLRALVRALRPVCLWVKGVRSWVHYKLAVEYNTDCVSVCTRTTTWWRGQRGGSSRAAILWAIPDYSRVASCDVVLMTAHLVKSRYSGRVLRVPQGKASLPCSHSRIATMCECRMACRSRSTVIPWSASTPLGMVAARVAGNRVVLKVCTVAASCDSECERKLWWSFLTCHSTSKGACAALCLDHTLTGACAALCGRPNGVGISTRSVFNSHSSAV